MTAVRTNALLLNDVENPRLRHCLQHEVYDCCYNESRTLKSRPFSEAVSAIAAQKYTPGTAQSVHVFSPHDVPITTTTNAPPIIYPSLSTTMKDPVVYPPGLPVVYPPPLVAAQDSNSVCLHDTDFAADCSGNFMKCVHGVAYPMKCPAVSFFHVGFLGV